MSKSLDVLSGFSENAEEQHIKDDVTFKKLTQNIPKYVTKTYVAKITEGIDSDVLSDIIHEAEPGNKPEALVLGYLTSIAAESGEFILETDYVDFIGLELAGGKLMVEGDAGECAGTKMTGGIIKIHGDAGLGAGFKMSCGEIYFENGGSDIGREMKNGLIHASGSVGNACARRMQGGTIIIKGDARDLCGEGMQNGLIEVSGNTGFKTGDSMNGGQITVGGDAGNWLGNNMQNGHIKVSGSIGSVRNPQGGSIEGEILRIEGVVKGELVKR